MITFQDKTYAESSLYEIYKSQGYSDFLIALKIANENITKKILSIQNDTWSKRKLTETKKLIDDEILATYGGLFEQIGDESVTSANLLYGLMLDDLTATLPKATVDKLLQKSHVVQTAYSYKTIDGVLQKQKYKEYTFEKLFLTQGKRHAEKLKTIIDTGILEKLTPVEIAKKVDLKSVDLSQGVIVGNIFTTVSQARSLGRTEAFKELQNSRVIKFYEYNATLDNSTTHWCKVHDNKKYLTIEAINKDLNTHFRERSIAIPRTGEEENTSRASQTGKTNAESYEKWFLQQPKSFQKSTLNSRTYEAFLKGKYKVESLTDLNGKASIGKIQSVLKMDYIN